MADFTAEKPDEEVLRTSEEELQDFIENTTHLMAEAKFQLRGWECTRTIKEEVKPEPASVLGLLWDIEEYVLFCYKRRLEDRCDMDLAAMVRAAYCGVFCLTPVLACRREDNASNYDQATHIGPLGPSTRRFLGGFWKYLLVSGLGSNGGCCSAVRAVESSTRLQWVLNSTRGNRGSGNISLFPDLAVIEDVVQPSEL
uniref:Uncharacterized protein n=1 Tax=Timema bartmani TaxID=61472 RepID=A0A7R9F4Z2_9NEOP|nr:unnamed protein product [Timema bartmani]